MASWSAEDVVPGLKKGEGMVNALQVLDIINLESYGENAQICRMQV
jgi:hypothetical protein